MISAAAHPERKASAREPVVDRGSYPRTDIQSLVRPLDAASLRSGRTGIES